MACRGFLFNTENATKPLTPDIKRYNHLRHSNEAVLQTMRADARNRSVVAQKT